MSLRRRGTVPGGFHSPASALLDSRSQANPAPLPSDDQPPSGIVLRLEVLESVPRLAVSMAELMALPLNDRAGFILSFVDGSYTIGMILDACAMRREDALAVLGELV